MAATATSCTQVGTQQYPAVTAPGPDGTAPDDERDREALLRAGVRWLLEQVERGAGDPLLITPTLRLEHPLLVELASWAWSESCRTLGETRPGWQGGPVLAVEPTEATLRELRDDPRVKALFVVKR